MRRSIIKNKERVNLLVSKDVRDKFRKTCENRGIIMSVVVEKAMLKFCENKEVV